MSLQRLTKSLIGVIAFIGMESVYRLYIRSILRRNLGILRSDYSRSWLRIWERKKRARPSQIQSIRVVPRATNPCKLRLFQPRQSQAPPARNALERPQMAQFVSITSDSEGDSRHVVIQGPSLTSTERDLTHNKLHCQAKSPAQSD
jgi:hypothetical protein